MDASQSATRSGASQIVEALALNGVDRVFCVPGESYLDVLDALHARADRIQAVACRHESGAAMMAEADGKLTGRPGICMVTRGPGATNASAGVHVAFQDSTPMILFVGQVGRDVAEREAFQEIDYRRMFGQMAKWVAQIDSAHRVPELVARAFAVATSGRPGPVVLAVPEDMLVEHSTAPPARAHRALEIFPAAAQLQALRQALAGAERPLLILGGSRWREETRLAVERFAGANDLPVAAAFRRQDRFDNGHPCYAGDIGIGVNPKLKMRIQDADLLIVLGARLDEMTTGGYALIDIPNPRQTMIHIHAGAEELGRVYQADLAINATPDGFASMLGTIEPVPERARWSAWRRAARAAYADWQNPTSVPGPVNLGEIIQWLSGTLSDNAIITNGAGNFTAWVHRFHRYHRVGTQLAPISGSMGYGVPAAIAAKLRHPDRPVICVAGDGDFLMTGQELATAVQYHAPIIIVIADNAMYGTIRMHQERRFPGRVVATSLRNPDFVALAKAYGAFAERVDDTGSFAAAYGRARAAGTPAVLHLKIDPEAITPEQSLSQIRRTAAGAAGLVSEGD